MIRKEVLGGRKRRQKNKSKGENDADIVVLLLQHKGKETTTLNKSYSLEVLR